MSVKVIPWLSRREGLRETSGEWRVVWQVREGNWLAGESVNVIGWLSDEEGLRESSGDFVNVIGWLSEWGGVKVIC